MGKTLLVIILGVIMCSPAALSLAPPQQQAPSRRAFFRTTTAAAVAAFPFLSYRDSSVVVPSALAYADSIAAAAGDDSNGAAAAAAAVKKVLGLSDAELQKIVKSDLLDKQFLVTGNLTRSIYKPTATFTDEIDTYSMDQWMKGTQRLFVGAKSDVRLVGDVTVTAARVEFLFDEDLMFNFPFIKPIVSLSGKVILTRDVDSGFITSYREFWDQDVATVLKTAKF